jgi:hypothetical protein
MHPFALKTWLFCDDAARALAATPDRIDAFQSWVRELADEGKVLSRETNGYVQVQRASLAAVCLERGVPLGKLDPQWTDEPPRHPAQDRAHPYYSREVDATIAAWDAVVAKGLHEAGSHGPRAPIITFLEENFSDLEPSARSRVATVVNPAKNFGAPRAK